MIANCEKSRTINILMAEDDPDDQLLVREALAESKCNNMICFVRDGVELMDYLNRRDGFADIEKNPFPDLILLDLNLPRMDGREVLKAIKADPKLCGIPVVVLTTSKAEKDILGCYTLGASSFITKPIKYSEFVRVMSTLGEYWASIVRLPVTKYRH